MKRTDLAPRLQALRVTVAESTAQRHLADITAALTTTSAVPARPHRPRRRLLLAAAVLTLVVPATAIAAEQADPEDALYPVKLATEWMRSPVDPWVSAHHRLDELERAIDQGAPAGVLRDRYHDAADAVAAAPERADLRRRLGEAYAFVDRSDRQGPVDTPRSDRADPLPPSTTRPAPRRHHTSEPPPDATTTHAPAGDDQRPATTTRDRPPGEDGGRTRDESHARPTSTDGSGRDRTGD